ncbi:hypothetical protein KSS87_005600 [Heliosperma pusillum]|nr:hypothetical protein KSS87_005600 [Heliosperma pusillum]
MASSTQLFSHLPSTHFHQTNPTPTSTPIFFFKTPQINFTKPSNISPKLTISPLSSKGFYNFTPKASMTEVKSQKGTLGSFEIFDSEETVAISLAKYTAELSEKFVKSRGFFTVVVSGGSLIKSLRTRALPPFELAFGVGSPLSYIKLVRFLVVPILPDHVHAINDTLQTKEAAEDYETRLKQLVDSKVLATSDATGFPKFDAMLLGMGPDGHVASLFPGHPLVKEDKKWVTHILDSPKPPPERITFTFPVINSSAYIALVVCGAGKAGIVKSALSGENQSSEVLPVQMVSPEGELKWFLDNDAASQL